MLKQVTQRRGRDRLTDSLWQATVQRVRGEFEEMPSLRVSPEEARALFGLPDGICEGVLRRLEADGFLDRTQGGEYVRQAPAP
jgi:hypothetical protein